MRRSIKRDMPSRIIASGVDRIRFASSCSTILSTQWKHRHTRHCLTKSLYERFAQVVGPSGLFSHASTPLESVALGSLMSSMSVSNTSCRRLEAEAAYATITGSIFWTRGSGAPWRDILKRQGKLDFPRLPTLGLWRHP